MGIAALVLTLAACDRGRTDGIAVDNRTAETLYFRVFGDGEWFDLPYDAPPRRKSLILGGSAIHDPSRVTEGGCTTGEMVALDAEGREVARHPPGLCVHDVWVITDPTATEPP